AEEVTNIYKVGQNTSRLLLACGDLVTAWLLLRQAEIALERLGGELSEADRAFYTGKVAAARFFATTRLPLVSAERAVTEATTGDLMDLPEEAF
ncbi:MAG: acyl-CoA dehydrogenase C-terminal domain-containing protein, partial [Actinoallomurus sp.]